MKRSIRSRMKNDLFPQMPQSFADGLQRALLSTGAHPRKTHLRYVFAGAAAAVLVAACFAMIFLIGGIGRKRTSFASETYSLNETTLLGTWTLSQYDYNGMLVSTDFMEARVSITFRDDGTAVLSDLTTTALVTSGGQDSLTVYSYSIQKNTVTIEGFPGILNSGSVLTYDHKADTLTASNEVSEGVEIRCIFVRAQETVPAKKTAAGIWSHTAAADCTERLTIRGDGTATLQVFSNGGTETLELTYTEGADRLHFTGGERTFHAQYQAEDDTLSVVENRETAIFTRCIPDLADSRWTLTGIEVNGIRSDPGVLDLRMYLEFQKDAGLIATILLNDETDREEYRYFVNGTSIDVTASDGTIRQDTIVYDAATDTLRMDVTQENPSYMNYSGFKATLIFSRTRDAVIPALTPDSAVDALQQEYKRLEKQYPEYFGLDTSKGLKVYVWQMSNNSYSCALLKGSDNKTDAEIGGMRGVTIEEMLLILNTYETEDNDIDVEVVPFRNPLSSYWYEIDEAYTEKLVWLLNGTPNPAPFLTESSESGETAYQVDDPEHMHILNVLTDVEVCDVDGDGRLESCRLSLGPTSGLFTVVFTVYRNGTVVYRNTFNMDYGTANFVPLDEGLSLEFVFAKNEPWTVRYLVTIENGVIVLTNMVSGNQVEYWGELDPQWNRYTKKAVERRFDGAWYSFSKGLLSDPAYDQLLLISFDPDGEHVSFTEDRTRYEGYTYRIEPGDKPAIVLTDEKTGDVRRAVLDGTTLTFESAPYVNGERSAFEYKSVPRYEAADLPYAEPILPVRTETSANWRDMPFCMFDLDGDGEKELIELYWDETSRSMQIKVIKPQTKVKEVQLPVMPQVFTSDEQAIIYTVEDVTDPGNLILVDLDPNDGHGNLLLSTTRADGTERTYELHVEGDAIVCGHTVEGYCFLNDSEQQELMLATPSDLLGAKYGYREVKGEALEPADEWLQASALIERIMFGKREDNIKDGMLLHLVRALPCEIDGKPATLEPGVYLHLREWHESMDRIVFLTEDDRRITVRLDGTAPYAVGGTALADYFDNTP